MIPLAFGALRLRPMRRLPIAYGWLTNGPIDREAEDSYVLPVLTRGAIRRDVRKLLGRPRPDVHARRRGEAGRAGTGPALIAWSEDDRFFPPAHGERLAKVIPGARLELDRGRAHVLAGGPAGAAGRADRRIRPYGGVSPRMVSAEPGARSGGAVGLGPSRWPDISGGPRA